MLLKSIPSISFYFKKGTFPGSHSVSVRQCCSRPVSSSAACALPESQPHLLLPKASPGSQIEIVQKFFMG